MILKTCYILPILKSIHILNQNFTLALYITVAATCFSLIIFKCMVVLYIYTYTIVSIFGLSKLHTYMNLNNIAIDIAVARGTRVSVDSCLVAR